MDSDTHTKKLVMIALEPLWAFFFPICDKWFLTKILGGNLNLIPAGFSIWKRSSENTLAVYWHSIFFIRVPDSSSCSFFLLFCLVSSLLIHWSVRYSYNHQSWIYLKLKFKLTRLCIYYFLGYTNIIPQPLFLNSKSFLLKPQKIMANT